MTDLLNTVVTPSVAIVATFVGILVALSQLTAGVRLRKQAEHWKVEFNDAALEHDKAVFQSLHRRALAKLVAKDAIPLRRLAVTAGSFVPSIWLPAFASSRLITDPSLVTNVLFAIFVLLGIIGQFIGLGHYSVLNRARRSVYDAFLDGRNLESAFDAMPDRKEALDILGWRGALEVLMTSVSISALVVYISASITQTVHAADVAPGWLGSVASLGVIAIFYLLYAIASSQDFRRSDKWVHPKRLSASARVSVEKEVASPDV